MTESDHVVLRLFIMAYGSSSEQREDEDGKGRRCCTQSLMGDAGGILGPNACRNVDTASCSHKLSYKNKNAIRNLTRVHSCYTLINSSPTFCPCPETLWEAKVKSHRIINLAEESPKQHSD